MATVFDINTYNSMQLGTRKMGTGVMSEPLSARSGYQSQYPMNLMSGNKSRGHTR